jgi:hypothetical protein
MRLKLLSLLMIICFHGFSLLDAQIFNAGIMAGLNISQVDGDGFAGYNKAGAAFGAFVNTYFSGSWGGQLEINFSSKGSQLKTTSENPQYYRIDLQYIEIPLLAQYHFPGISLEAGFSGGYLFFSREKDATGDIPVTHPFRKTEFAFLGGFAWFLSDRISFNPRFSYSLFPVRDHAGGGRYRLNLGQNNNVLSFLVRYRFK